jgi:hypothetical protein
LVCWTPSVHILCRHIRLSCATKSRYTAPSKLHAKLLDFFHQRCDIQIGSESVDGGVGLGKFPD